MATLDDVVGKKLGPQDFFDIYNNNGMGTFHFDFEHKFGSIQPPSATLDIWMRDNEGRREWYEKFSEVELTGFFYNGHKIEGRFAPTTGANRSTVYSFEFKLEHRPKISIGAIWKDEFYAYVSYGQYPRNYSERTEFLVRTHPKMEMR